MTTGVDIGFAAAAFNLNYVDERRIRIIARGSDVPEQCDMTHGQSNSRERTTLRRT